MSWFDQLRQCLVEYYPAGGPSDVVGYLRGSASPVIWQQMEARRPQMLVLGSMEPNYEDWVAAGVPHRVGETRVVTLEMCANFIILYAGFIRRPWGSIVIQSADALNAFPGSLESWKRNRPRTQ